MPLVLDVIINLVPLSVKVRLLETDDDGDPTDVELDLDEYAKRYEGKMFGMRKRTKGNTALYCAPIPLTTEYDYDGEPRFVYIARKAYIIDDLKGSPMKIVDSLVSACKRWSDKASSSDFRLLGDVRISYDNGIHPSALPSKFAWEFRFVLSMGTPNKETDDDDFLLYGYGDFNELVNSAGRFKCPYFKMEWERVMDSPLLLHPNIVEETGPIQYLWGLRARKIGDLPRASPLLCNLVCVCRRSRPLQGIHESRDEPSRATHPLIPRASRPQGPSRLCEPSLRFVVLLHAHSSERR